MKIIFTKHARERMKERDVFEKEVIECTKHPDKIVKEHGSIYRFQKRFSYGILQVVGEQKRNYCVVITAYPL